MLWPPTFLAGTGAVSVCDCRLRESSRPHLADIGQPVVFPLVCESMNDEVGFSVCFEIGAPDF